MLACWFSSSVSRSCSELKVIGHSSWSQEEKIAKVVDATSSEGCLVLFICLPEFMLIGPQTVWDGNSI